MLQTSYSISVYQKREPPDGEDGLRKGSRTREQIPNICWIIDKAKEFQKKFYFWFIDYAKFFDCVNHKKLWKILQEIGIQDHLTYLLRNLYAGQDATVRTRHETIDWFQIGKGYVKVVYCHPAYLTYTQCTSWEMLGWMKHKLELRFLDEISITSDMQMTPPLWKKVKKN